MARIPCNSVLLALALLLAARACLASPSRPDPEIQQRAFLVIRENCLACHGSLRNGSLDLRTREGFLKGGTRGPAIVPGKPDQSRLFRFVSGHDKIQMPPAKKLDAAKIAILRTWIESGAPWPAAVAVDDRPWAFQPIKRPAIPQIRNPQSAIRNPIDSFVMAKLRSKGLNLAPEADRRTLIRRLSFDLIGLPPTPEEVEAFVADRASDAYEKLVDRLLASPHYGERWARHWLDLARYAESEGFKADEMRPNAWRYRDYVIRSLNADKPYDRFVREQIAGDELYPDDPDALIATGFCRHWPDESNAQNLASRRQEILNDISETTASSILGLTVGCARCHDHKFDPITQKDYYRLQAFFAAVRPRNDLVALPPRQRAEWETREQAWEGKTAQIRKGMTDIEEPARERIYKDRFKRFPDDVQQAVNADPKRRTALQWVLYHKALPQLEFSESTIVGGMKPEQKQQWTALSKSLHAFDSIKPEPLPTALGITDVGPEAPKTYCLAAGVYDKPKEEVQPGVFTILGCAVPAVPVAAPNTTGRRSALAAWLTNPSNPFTARVIVNRVWQYHFGRGIVGTSSDLGNAGDRPTHPELLDWLASELVQKGWSLKQLHRLIVTSATYRQACISNVRSGRLDPENRLLWRYPRQRLEGEVIRDSILAVSGTLNDKMGGPSVMPDLPSGVTTRGYWKETADPAERNRRSVYVFVKRNMRFPLFEAFDMPDTHEPCARRDVTTTAPQALMLLNDESVLDAARHFAGRVVKLAAQDHDAQITAAYRLAFDRIPTAEEKSLALEFLTRQSAILHAEPKRATGEADAALVDLCHALLNSNEFLYTE
jgi:mono/diheme cytochrome c family protein